MEDLQILEALFARSEKALAALAEKYGKGLFSLAMNILGSRADAEETVNDTYLALWNAIPPQRPDSLSAYLSKLVRRISIDRLRRSTAHQRGGTEYALSLSELAGCVSGGVDPEASMETKRLAKTLSGFLRSLPEQERHLFIGRYYFMDSLKEAARYCGMSESKAKSMLFRIRCRLRECLTEEGFVV